MTGCNLAAPDHALGPAQIAQHDMGIVVERPARAERVEIGGKAFELLAGDKAAEIIGMRADIADRPAAAGLFRVDAPRRLFLAGLLNALG